MSSVWTLFIVVGAVYAAIINLTDAFDVDIQCVPLRECPEFLKLLQETPVSEKTTKLRELLKTSHCGFDGNDPKVWCTRLYAVCTTPNGKKGKCLPAKKCESFIQVLKTTNGLSMDTKTYLQQFQCDDFHNADAPSVCCPTDKDAFVQKPTPASRPTHFPRPNQGECGPQLADRVLGGKVTEMDEFPWTALLEYDSYDFRTNSAACAGSLISKRYVVTAAHCVDDTAVRRLGKVTNVILGEFHIRNETDCINSLGIKDCADPPLRVAVENIVIYPKWFTKPRALLDFDVALICLASDVTYTSFIRPICLPSSSLVLKEGEKLVVTGWGITEEGSESYVKRKTTLPVANRNACLQKYKQDKRLTVGESEICVGGEEGKDSCSGDSGGPLMVSINRGDITAWFLVGIISFGPNQPCGVKDYPGLYTYVPQYVDWIYKTVRP